MVGLGPTIHEFLWPDRAVADKLVDGRAKHDHDEWVCGMPANDYSTVIPALSRDLFIRRTCS
jgi:hypothetical protein